MQIWLSFLLNNRFRQLLFKHFLLLFWILLLEFIVFQENLMRRLLNFNLILFDIDLRNFIFLWILLFGSASQITNILLILFIYIFKLFLLNWQFKFNLMWFLDLRKWNFFLLSSIIFIFLDFFFLGGFIYFVFSLCFLENWNFILWIFDELTQQLGHVLCHIPIIFFDIFFILCHLQL